MPEVSMTVNGRAVRSAVEGRTMLVDFLRETARSDRHACRLRHDAVRRVCRARERPGYEVVHHARAPMRGRGGHHHRGCGRARSSSPPDAGGLPGAPRASVRLLHVGHGDDGARYRASLGEPDEATIREELKGNICRCTGYHNIVKAIAAGAKAMATEQQVRTNHA